MFILLKNKQSVIEQNCYLETTEGQQRAQKSRESLEMARFVLERVYTRSITKLV